MAGPTTSCTNTLIIRICVRERLQKRQRTQRSFLENASNQEAKTKTKETPAKNEWIWSTYRETEVPSFLWVSYKHFHDHFVSINWTLTDQFDKKKKIFEIILNAPIFSVFQREIGKVGEGKRATTNKREREGAGGWREKGQIAKFMLVLSIWQDANLLPEHPPTTMLHDKLTGHKGCEACYHLVADVTSSCYHQ